MYSMGLVFVGFKSISKRSAQPDKTSKRAEIANHIEHLEYNFQEVSKIEAYMLRVINGDGITMYFATYESFFASILLYGLRHAKCEQLLGNCPHDSP